MKFKSKKISKKPVFKKKYNKRKQKTLIVKTESTRMPRGSFSNLGAVMPLPNTMKTKFVYVGEEILSSGSSGSTTIPADYTWRLNGIQDPYTGITSNYNVGCNGFGQVLSANGPYGRYKVNGVLIEVEAYDPDGTNDDGTEICGLLSSPDLVYNLVGYNAQQVEALPYGCVKRVSGTGSQRRFMRQYVPLANLFGWSKTQYKNDIANTTAPYTSVPNAVPLLHIGIANRRGPATATTVIVKVKLTFYATLYAHAQS